MLVIDIRRCTVMLVDNQAVVINTSLPSSTIKKKHNLIAYHQVCEAVAAGIVKVAHIRSTMNIADILTKPLGPMDYWTLTHDVLFGRKLSDQHGTKGELQEIVHRSTNRTMIRVSCDWEEIVSGEIPEN